MCLLTAVLGFSYWVSHIGFLIFNPLFFASHTLFFISEINKDIYFSFCSIFIFYSNEVQGEKGFYQPTAFEDWQER